VLVRQSVAMFFTPTTDPSFRPKRCEVEKPAVEYDSSNPDPYRGTGAQYPASPSPPQSLGKLLCHDIFFVLLRIDSLPEERLAPIILLPHRLRRSLKVLKCSLTRAGVCAITVCVTGSIRNIAPQSVQATSNPISFFDFFPAMPCILRPMQIRHFDRRRSRSGETCICPRGSAYYNNHTDHTDHNEWRSR